MKIFISWSGDKSRQVALLLEEWIKCIIQASEPWMSTNIDRGGLWFSEINEQLASVSLGIICLTAENKDKPWILFEAGALAKGLQTNRVCTLLIDLKNEDIEQPLAQFNHTNPDREGMWQLVNTINIHIGDNRLPQNILEKVFAKNWSDFEEKFAIIQQLPSQPVARHGKRESEEILIELLNTVRSFDKRLQSVELLSNPDHFSRKHEAKLYDEYRAERNGVAKYETEKIFELITNLAKQGRTKGEILTKALANNKLFTPGTVLRMVESGLEKVNQSVN